MSLLGPGRTKNPFLALSARAPPPQSDRAHNRMRIRGRGSAPAASVRPRALGGSLTVVLALTGCDGLSPGTGRQTRSSPGDPRQRPDHPGGGVAAGSYRSPVRRRAAAPAPSPMPPGAWSTPRPGPCTPPSPGAGARRRPTTPPPPPPPTSRSASPILTAPGGVPPTRTRAARSASTSPRALTSTTSAHPRARAARGRLNRRPREVLNGQTPTEILDTIINGATTPRHRHGLHFRGRNARLGVRGAAASGAAVREIVG